MIRFRKAFVGTLACALSSAHLAFAADRSYDPNGEHLYEPKPCFSCIERALKPDLAIVFLRTPLDAQITNAGWPIEMLIENKGSLPSGAFKISAGHIQSGETILIMLTNGPSGNSWYVWHNTPIAPGKVAIIPRYLRFEAPVAAGYQDLIVSADSCSGDEFVADYCRVDELNEDNNDFVFSQYLR